MIETNPKRRLFEIAGHYLKQDPFPWINFSQTLAEVITSSILDSGAGELNRLGEKEIASALKDSILSCLVEPRLVRSVAKARSVDSEIERIAMSLSEELSETILDSRYKEGGHWDDIIDVTDGGVEERPFVVPRWTSWDSLDDDPPKIMSLHRKFQFDSSPEYLKKLVSTIIHAENTLQINKAEATTQSLVRLDLIDLALYKTLVEHPELMKSLNWRVFEKLLADILETFGYEIELQRGTKDGGIDIFAVKKEDSLGPHRYILQAKRWSNQVGVEPVRQLMFLHSYHRATKSCLATTATFSKGALQLANQYRWQLELRDFKGIQEWLVEAMKLK